MASNPYEKYEIQTVDRSQVKNAPYNPRVISGKAKKRLRENLKKVGLVEPPIWNKRTGNLVGGHQRMAALDALMGKKDYQLQVSVVDMDEATEKAQNIFLNNGEAQGTWDLVKLEEMFVQDKVDFELAGFDTASVFHLFGDMPLAQRPEAMQEMADRLRKTQEVVEQIGKREHRPQEDQDFYLVVVFRDNQARDSFTKALGLPDNRYVDGATLQGMLDHKASESVSK